MVWFDNREAHVLVMHTVPSTPCALHGTSDVHAHVRQVRVAALFGVHTLHHLAMPLMRCCRRFQQLAPCITAALTLTACLESGETPLGPSAQALDEPGRVPASTPTRPPTSDSAARLQLLPTSVEVTANAHRVTVHVRAAAGVAWRVDASTVPWLEPEEPVVGVGDGRLVLLVMANAGPRRLGVVRINDATVTVTQAAVAPTPGSDLERRLAFRPESIDVPDTASALRVALKAPSASWTMRRTDRQSAAWVWLPADSVGRGSAEKQLRFSPNLGPMRAALIQAFTADGAEAWLLVQQAGVDGRTPVPDPQVQLAASLLEYGASGSSVTLRVDAAPDHCWSIVPPTTDWLTIAISLRQCGPVELLVRTTPNRDHTRGAALFVAGRAVRVVQRGAAPTP